MSKVLIVANGDLELNDWFLKLVQRNDRVIAVDGGANYLYKISAVPDLFIGDGDSVSGEVNDWLKRNGVVQHRYPTDKDYTDLEIAIRHCDQYVPTLIQIVAGFGGRVDHELANVFLLVQSGLTDCSVSFVDRYQQVTLIKDESKVYGVKGDHISLIPVVSDVKVEQTSGLKWELENEYLQLGSTRGISNVMTGSEAAFKISEGWLICVKTKSAKI